MGDLADQIRIRELAEGIAAANRTIANLEAENGRLEAKEEVVSKHNFQLLNLIEELEADKADLKRKVAVRDELAHSDGRYQFELETALDLVLQQDRTRGYPTGMEWAQLCGHIRKVRGE